MIPDPDLHVDIAKQISDEARHYKLYLGRLGELGESFDVRRHRPPDGWRRVFKYLYKSGDPLVIAAGLNVTIEGAIVGRYDPDSYVEPDPGTAKIIEEIRRDEPSHVQIGIKILERYATTERKQRLVETVIEHVISLTSNAARQLRSVMEVSPF